MPDVIDDDLTAEHEPDALERRATMLLDRLGAAESVPAGAESSAEDAMNGCPVAAIEKVD